MDGDFTLLSDPAGGWRFAFPEALWGLLLIPLLILLRGKSGDQSAVVFSSLHILKRMGVNARAKAGRIRLALVFLTMALLIGSLARPQKFNVRETRTETGVELILAIDVSSSMQVADFTLGGRKATRLQAAKKVTRDFIRGRSSDRIGLLAFAGRPYLASPITLDQDWLAQSMQRVTIGAMRKDGTQIEDGTAIGSAIAAAARRLDKRPAKSKVIVLLTDGVNNAGNLDPIQAANLARTLGIRIYTIAVGTYGQYSIQTRRGPQRLVQEFDEETLKEIARIGDGEYFRAQDITSLEKIFSLIDSLEKSEISHRVTISTREYFQWPAGLALLLGLLSLVGGETFWRRFP